MSATAAFDRTADRDDIAAKMDEYARQGGMISKLDYAGNLVGLEAEAPKPRPTAKILPMRKPKPVEGFIELDDRPVVQLTPVEVIPEPELKRRAKVLPFPSGGRPGKPVTLVPARAATTADMIKALRSLRVDAERAIARLNAVFPGRSK